MKDYTKFLGKEIRIKRYGFGKLMKMGKNTFTFKIPVDDMKWENIELDLRYLKSAKCIKDSELNNNRFRISFITKNFYQKHLSWTGRSTRKEYFFGRLISLLVLLIPTAALGHFIVHNEPKRLFVYIACGLIVLGVITFAGTISITARRLQDLGYKGILSLVFYSIILTLLSYGLWTLEDPIVFILVLEIIYFIFEIIMICTVSDFDNKYGPCPIARLDDDEHIDGRAIIKKEGSFSNMKEFTEKIKEDNKQKEEELSRKNEIEKVEKALLEKQKIEKEKRKEKNKQRETSGESIKELSERIRNEVKTELEKNPERLRKLPEKKDTSNDKDFLVEKAAREKIEISKLLKEYEVLYENGEISKEEYYRLREELIK